MRGSSAYEKINMAMNLLSIISLIVKYSYEQQWQGQYKPGDEEFIDLNSWVYFQLAIFILDCVVMFGCAISVSKQLISWLPQTFKLYTDLMLSMINLNQLM